MPKPLRLPNASEQALLDGLNLRLLTDPEDKQRWDELVIERHYLLIRPQDKLHLAPLSPALSPLVPRGARGKTRRAVLADNFKL